ncbi:MAG TPA: exosortase/archaeosortase family protein [Tepidisphaeraceae bacterium]|jgi:exosortase|nr:exosortase/archaeosortase family protein [Tepidisphaeraceae bacterium]
MPSNKIASKRQWTVWHPVALIVLLTLGVAATWDAWRDIFEIVNKDEESSHVWLVLPIALWLAWMRRGRLRRCTPTGLLLGPIFIIIGSVIYLFGGIYVIQFPWHLGAVIVLVGCIIGVLGKDILVQFAPAFLILVFLVPFPGRLRQMVAIPLEGITANITANCCEILGMPVERLGTVLRINGVDVAIEEACNGLRMVFSLTLVCYAIAFSSPLRGYVRLGMVIASPLLAVICNIVRLIPTVWLYGYSKLSTANHFHDISGWLMPPAGFLALLGVVRLLRWAMIPVSKFTLAYG